MSQIEKELQDKLLIEMLDLIEQSVLCKMNIESTTNAGQLLLAKSRYIQGPQTVSVSQLPTENSNDFNALKTVTRQEDEINDELQLSTHKVDKENGFIDTIRWFGVLVPRSLQLAQERFNKAIELVVECANIQTKLNNTIRYILLLRNKSS
ncbi:coiled-coil domain-containing protein 115-like [Sitodiplosis mosellana]|uniref:coiled-coil domain-containing protein 115-like n=1 Tax=Sitodiplosis mosellana TaxID=263140 RepID=UPI002443ECFC|nr:coiled-coil domain-containing protein 115-like [Sitodiplosis mosellana]